MKIAISETASRITSTLARSDRAARGTGRAPCFKRIFRDCGSDVVWLEFADGSFYRYESPAIADAVNIIAADTHGLDFNRIFRRAINTDNRYARVDSIPNTAEKIYEFPPYPGQPVPPCAVDLWTWEGFDVSGEGNVHFVPGFDETNPFGAISALLATPDQLAHGQLYGAIACPAVDTDVVLRVQANYNSPNAAEALRKVRFVVQKPGPDIVLFEYFYATNENGGFEYPLTIPGDGGDGWALQLELEVNAGYESNAVLVAGVSNWPPGNLP